METQETSVPEKKDSKSDLWIYSIDNKNTQETGSLSNAIDNGMTEQSSSSLDEGEIVDDEDEEILAKDEKSLSQTIEFFEKSPNQHQNLNKESYNEDIISEVDVDESEEKFEEGECCEQSTRKVNNSIDEIGSNYSDWSESEDDDLLKGGQEQPTEMTNIKSEPMDNDHEAIAVMNPIITDVDLEAISDDDFESTPIDDIQNKAVVDCGESSDFEKLFPKEEEEEDDDESSCYPIQVKSDHIESISILDTLKIDWKSLISNRENAHDIEGQEERTTKIKEDKDKKARSEDFRKRNSTISILNRIGFSHRLAGEKLTPLINEYLSEQLGEDYQPMLSPMPALHTFYRNKLKQNIFGLTVKAGAMIMNGDKDRSFLELVKHPF